MPEMKDTARMIFTCMDILSQANRSSAMFHPQQPSPGRHANLICSYADQIPQ